MSAGVGRVDACDLCEAAPLTTRYHEDDLCWVAECDACSVPMVVWRLHGAVPPPDDVQRMVAELTRVATAHFGEGEFTVDLVMRQIPDHFHAHARRRWRSPYGASATKMQNGWPAGSA